MIKPPDPTVAIVTPTGIMQETFRLFTLLVSLLDIEVGTGSPEGVVEALQRTLYLDDTGVSGSILYIKRDDNIGNDKARGWIAV